MRITDLKFWKRYCNTQIYPDKKSAGYKDPPAYLSIATYKKVKIQPVPGRHNPETVDSNNKDLAIMEMVIGGRSNIATIDKADQTVYSHNPENQDNQDNQDNHSSTKNGSVKHEEDGQD